jgi:hypothetical protein
MDIVIGLIRRAIYRRFVVGKLRTASWGLTWDEAANGVELDLISPGRPEVLG